MARHAGPAAPRWIVRHAAARELALFVFAYLTYFGVRAATEGAAETALCHARSLVRIERSLGIGWEHAFQSVIAGSGTLVEFANGVYVYGHWPVMIVSGVLLYRYRREHYYTLRNACLLTGVIGVAIFALYPVAPPRLTDLPLIDTLTRDSPGYRQILPPALVNQYAAMPSFHAGWNLLLAIVIFRATRRRVLRGFAVVMPVAMAFAVVATANHFVLDVVIGCLIVLAALRLIDVRDQRRRNRDNGSPGLLRVARRRVYHLR